MSAQQTDAAYAQEIRTSQRRAQTVERKAILGYRMMMALLLSVAAFAFVPINAAHNFQFFEGIIGKIAEGGGHYSLYVAVAAALVIAGAAFWTLLPQTGGFAFVCCLSAAIAAGVFSHYASYLSLDTQTVATIQQETADSAKSKIAMMGVEAMKSQVEAASANSKTASAAVNNLTSQFSGYDAASVGEINRSQMPGYLAAQNAAAAQLNQSTAAMERAMRAANEASSGAGEGTVATVFKDFGKQMGWTPEGTRIFTNAFGSGIISWLPLILTFIMGYVAFAGDSTPEPAPEPKRKKEPSGGGPDGAGVADLFRGPARPKAMAATATVSDTIRGPLIEEKPRVPVAPKRPAAKPKDRTPNNERQAAYSKKLSALKAAMASGEVKSGELLGYDRIKALVGGSTDTARALRNDLAAARLAHWRGKSLIAGEGA